MEGITTALSSSIGTMATNCMEMIASILPVALPIVGAGVVVGFGLKMFKKVTGKA